MYIVYYQAVQLFLFLFSLFSLIFFAKLKNENSYVPWQVLYVSFVETLVYAIFCFAGRDLTIVNENIALFRYVSWLITCPAILTNLLNIIGSYDTDVVIQMNMLLIWTVCSGILSAFYPGVMKWVCFLIGFCTCSFLYTTLIYIWQKKSVNLTNRQERKEILALFLVSWIIFPVLFVLGPEGTNAISLGTSMLCHAIGDMLAKNLCGGLMWRLQSKLVNNTEEDETTSNDLTKQIMTMDKLKGEGQTLEDFVESGVIVPKFTPRTWEVQPKQNFHDLEESKHSPTNHKQQLVELVTSANNPEALWNKLRVESLRSKKQLSRHSSFRSTNTNQHDEEHSNSSPRGNDVITNNALEQHDELAKNIPSKRMLKLALKYHTELEKQRSRNSNNNTDSDSDAHEDLPAFGLEKKNADATNRPPSPTWSIGGRVKKSFGPEA